LVINSLKYLIHINSPQKYELTKKDETYSDFFDKIEFSKADKNSDDFLTYDELKDLKLSLDFDAKDDKFEFVKGLGLSDEELFLKILFNRGLSKSDLQDFIKKIDKNGDKIISADEINPNLSSQAKLSRIDYRQTKFKEVKYKETSSKQIEALKNRIEAINKEIQSLKKSLNKFQNIQNVNGADNSKTAFNALQKSAEIKHLKQKYGDKDIEKLINVIQHSPGNNIDKILYQSGTKASAEEVTRLNSLITENIADKFDITHQTDKAAIESFSPANNPIIPDNNVDYMVVQIRGKIDELEKEKANLQEQISQIIEKM